MLIERFAIFGCPGGLSAINYAKLQQVRYGVSRKPLSVVLIEESDRLPEDLNRHGAKFLYAAARIFLRRLVR